MAKQISLNALWNSAVPENRVFNPNDFTHLPTAARRYLEHAMAEPLLERTWHCPRLSRSPKNARRNQIKNLDVPSPPSKWSTGSAALFGAPLPG